MGTEVLRPHDCLTQRIRVAPVVFHRRKNYYGNGSGLPKINNTNRKPTVRSERLGRPEQRRGSPEPMISKRSASTGDLRYKQPQNSVSNSSNNNLVLGQVTILRRGESLETKIEANNKNSDEQITVYGTGRLGPDPKMVPKQVGVGLTDIYAGSAFSISPSPRALPLPSFFNKKEGSTKCVDDSATSYLRRLLRLD